MKSFKQYLTESDEITQEYDSAKTSTAQIAKTFKAVTWKPNTVNLDYGGGKYDYATNYLEIYNVKNLVYDPFNRSSEHNKMVMEYIQTNKPDTATCNNVLNVIKEEAIRHKVIQHVHTLLKDGGTAYFLIYEGNRTGVGTPTSKGWQNNLPTSAYLMDVKQVFGNVQRKGNLLIATK